MKDSLSLVQILGTKQFAGYIAPYTIINVKSLYTNLPVDKVIQVIRKFHKKYHIENGYFILECMEFILQNNIIKLKKQFCHQIFGIAMGTPLAPVLANICLAIMNKEFKNKCQSESHPPTEWPEFFIHQVY